MKKKQLLSGVMALLLSASLCACGGSKTAEGTSEAAGESSEAETSNTLSEGTPSTTVAALCSGMTQDLASLDPHVDTDAGTRDVVFNLYEGLVKLLPMADLFRLLPAIIPFPMMQDLYFHIERWRHIP